MWNTGLKHFLESMVKHQWREIKKGWYLFYKVHPKYCGDGDEVKSSLKQKIHRDSEGDYYICPYCSSYRFPGEVESESNKNVYRWDCCHNGTFRTLIELEKKRPESKFSKYEFFPWSKVIDFEILFWK